LIAAISLTSAPASLARQAPVQIPTAEDFGRQAAIRNVSISPDGQHIAAVTSPDGKETVVSIWRTAAPGEAPKTLGASWSCVRPTRRARPRPTSSACSSSTSTARSG
jgi:hypothetical protein